jgi:hypothetical protein
MKVATLASFLALGAVAVSAQTTEGPRIFSGGNTSQIVSVKQSKSGLGFKVTTPFASAVVAQSPGTNGGPVILGRATAVSSREITAVRGEVAECPPTTSCPQSTNIGVVGFTPPCRWRNRDARFIAYVGSHWNRFGSTGGKYRFADRCLGRWPGRKRHRCVRHSFRTVRDCGAVQKSGPGNLLIGNVDGAHPVFRVDGTGKVFANGGFQTGGADFAESFAIRGNRAQYSPGDVLMVDATGDRRLTLAQEPYSTAIAGIYSTKPGILASPHDIQSVALKEEIPLAIVGVVALQSYHGKWSYTARGSADCFLHSGACHEGH